MSEYNSDFEVNDYLSDGIDSSDGDLAELFGYDGYDLNPVPSACTSRKWIHAGNSSQLNNRSETANKGKWMIFRPTEKIDIVWQKISAAVESGELGTSADVSTISTKSADHPNHVVCINTYDHTDEADVMRVRDQLRTMGFGEKLPYKTDAATEANQKECKYRR